MMTTGLEPKLDQVARKLGVRIMPDLRGELHEEDIAGFFPRSRRALYRLGMPYAETVCAVAHELGHAHYGDGISVDVVRDVRQERRADRWAARLLISEADYRMAEVLVGSHAGALAAELGVTVEFINIWRDSYERILVK